MNLNIFKSKTTAASMALLILSGVRLWAGDVTALQGIQEAIMSLVPMLLRSAIYSDTNRGAQSVIDAATASAPGAGADVPQAGGA